MNGVWRFLTKPRFTAPGYTKTVLLAIVVLVGSAYAGFRIGAHLEYRYMISHQFDSLGNSDGTKLRESVGVLAALQMSDVIIPGENSNLRENTAWLMQIRPKAPAEAVGIVDLDRALNYLALSRSEQATDPSQAAVDLSAARTILKALGWQELPNDKLMALPDVNLAWRLKRGRR